MPWQVAEIFWIPNVSAFNLLITEVVNLALKWQTKEHNIDLFVNLNLMTSHFMNALVNFFSATDAATAAAQATSYTVRKQL